MRARADEFWTEEREDGLLHRARPSAAGGRPDALVVLVHGLISDERMWKSEWVRSVLATQGGIDPDVFAFRYPAWPLSAGSTESAADALGQAIRNVSMDRARANGRKFGYEHVYFVTHSNGGRVVKHLVTLEARSARRELSVDRRREERAGGDAGGVVTIDGSHSISLRTRRVVNICVPHFGATKGATALLLLLGFLVPAVLLLPALVLRYTLGLAFKPFARLGWNAIPIELLPFWSAHARDEAAWCAERDACAAADLPFPDAVEFTGNDDAAADAGARDVLERFRGPGLRTQPFSAAHILTEEALRNVLPHVQDSVRALASPFVQTLAERTIAENQRTELTRLFPVRELLGVAGPAVDRDGTPTLPKHEGQQRAVFEFLDWHTSRNVPIERRFVVTGAAGVGKSRLLARLCRRRSIHHLAVERDSPAVLIDLKSLPVALVSSDAKIDASGSPRVGGAPSLWRSILSAWCSYADALAKGAASFQPGEFERLLREQPVVLVLDGVDDFLVRAGLSWDAMDAVMAELSPLADAQGSTVVLGCRDGIPGVDRFERNGWTRIRVQTVDEAFAIDRYPYLNDLLAHLRTPPKDRYLSDEQVTQTIHVLLTPLVLEAIGKSGLIPKETSVPAVLGLAVEGILRESRLSAVRGPIGAFEPATAAIDVRVGESMLQQLARAFYESDGATDAVQPQLDFAEIRRRLDGLARRWDHVDGSHAVATCPHCLLRRPEIVHRLLTTVFESRLPGHWNFAHRMWSEYLLAGYYVRCTTSENLAEFGAVAYLPWVTALAGQILGGWSPPAQFVERTHASSVESGNVLFVSNLFALAIWNPASQFGSDTVRAFLAAVEDPRLPWFPRCLLMSGLGVRLFAIEFAMQHPDLLPPGAGAGIDRSYVRHKTAIVAALERCLRSAGDGAPSCPPLRSLSWFFLGHLGAVGSEPWPKMSAPEPHEGLLRDVFGNLDDPRKRRTLEESVAELVRTDLERHSLRGPSSLHYLWFLLCFHAAGVLSGDSAALLVDVLTANGPYRRHWSGESPRSMMRRSPALVDVGRTLSAEFAESFYRAR